MNLKIGPRNEYCCEQCSPKTFSLKTIRFNLFSRSAVSVLFFSLTTYKIALRRNLLYISSKPSSSEHGIGSQLKTQRRSPFWYGHRGSVLELCNGTETHNLNPLRGSFTEIILHISFAISQLDLNDTIKESLKRSVLRLRLISFSCIALVELSVHPH